MGVLPDLGVASSTGVEPGEGDAWAAARAGAGDGDESIIASVPAASTAFARTIAAAAARCFFEGCLLPEYRPNSGCIELTDRGAMSFASSRAWFIQLPGYERFDLGPRSIMRSPVECYNSAAQNEIECNFPSVSGVLL